MNSLNKALFKNLISPNRLEDVPPVVLRITDHCRYVIGVDMGSSHITMLLCDLNGNQESLIDIEHNVDKDPTGTLSIIGKIVEQQYERLNSSLLGHLLCCLFSC